MITHSADDVAQIDYKKAVLLINNKTAFRVRVVTTPDRLEIRLQQ